MQMVAMSKMRYILFHIQGRRQGELHAPLPPQKKPVAYENNIDADIDVFFLLQILLEHVVSVCNLKRFVYSFTF